MALGEGAVSFDRSAPVALCRSVLSRHVGQARLVFLLQRRTRRNTQTADTHETPHEIFKS